MGDCRIRFQIASQLLLRFSDDGADADRDEAQNDHPQQAGGSSSSSSSTPPPPPPSNSNPQHLVTVVRTVSADTTVHDLLASSELPHNGKQGSSSSSRTVLDLLMQGDDGATVWDCTVHPATNITSQCIINNDNNNANSSTTKSSKPKSHTQTLYTAGWFPSGSLQILPSNATQPVTAAADVYDDRQYIASTAANDSNTQQPPAGRVQLLGANNNDTLPLPSQVLQSVTQRHATSTAQDDEHEHKAARAQRQQNRLRQQQAERERARRLEARIRKLREQGSSKNKTVSEQVQRMLVKSRATGRRDLKPQDRVYLHCVLWTTTTANEEEDDDDDLSSSQQEDYRYFSNQDTVGRILASFEEQRPSHTKKDGLLSELLVAVASNGKSKSSEPVEYRRLPVGLRLYEAANSYLSGNVDTVVIRWYDASNEEPTSSIVGEEAKMDGDDVAMSDATDVVDPDLSDVVSGDATSGANDDTSSAMVGNAMELEQTNGKPSSFADYKHLSTALIAMDEREDSKKKKKQSTSAAEKVRQMQIKSKAKGDAKRVKMPDRFFLELIVADDKASSSNAAASVSLEHMGPVFLAKTDPLHRLLRDSVRSPTDSSLSSWELLVPTKTEGDGGSYYSFRNVAAKDDSTAEVSWSDAERDGKIKCFDRILLRRFQAS